MRRTVLSLLASALLVAPLAAQQSGTVGQYTPPRDWPLRLCVGLDSHHVSGLGGLQDGELSRQDRDLPLSVPVSM